jgi:hypothetical protein
LKYIKELNNPSPDELDVLLTEEQQGLIKVTRTRDAEPVGVGIVRRFVVHELNDADRAAIKHVEALLDYHTEQAKRAFSGEGVVGGEGQDLGEYAMDSPKGENGLKLMTWANALGEMRHYLTGI